MSGEKETDYVVNEERLRRIREEEVKRERIRQEKAERAKLTSDINQQKITISAISNKLNELLQITPQGIKDTFESSVNDAEQWGKECKDFIKGIDIKDSNSSLKTHLNYLYLKREDGQKIIKNLTKNFTKDADTIEKSLRMELLDLNTSFSENKEILTQWSGIDMVTKISKDMFDIEQSIKEKRLPEATSQKNQLAQHLKDHSYHAKKCSDLFNQYEQEKELIKPWFENEIKDIDTKFESTKKYLTEGKFEDLNRNLSDLKKIVEIKTIESKELDEKNQKRNYVLESLKTVCKSMRFKSVTETVEGKGKSSRIIYIVDTYSQGKIKFYLSLDTIKADSAIVENHCMSEFDKVSESLQKNFGVKTKFKMLHEPSKPIKKRLGEIGGSGHDEVINAER